MKARRIAAAVVGSALGLSLTACGSSSSNSTASPKPVVEAPLTLAAFKTSLPRAVTGIKTAHLAMKSDILDMQGDFNYGPPLAFNMAGYATVQGQTVNYVERLIGTDLYMQSPGHTPPGKFLKIDLSTIPQTAGIFKLIHQMQTLGPAAMANQFKAATKSLKYDGTETIAAQQAQHYTVVVDAVAATRLVSGDAAAMAYAKRIGQITEEVYLASDHRPIRIVMPMPAPMGTMQMDFSNYGEPVQVATPSPSQIVSPSQLTGSSSSSSSS